MPLIDPPVVPGRQRRWIFALAMHTSSPLLLSTLSKATYTLLVLTTIVAAGLSCAALLSQAVRTSPHKSWKNNVNAAVIGASYVVLVRPPSFSSRIHTVWLTTPQAPRVPPLLRQTPHRDAPPAAPHHKDAQVPPAVRHAPRACAPSPPAVSSAQTTDD
ncbi:hypothetical protein C0993_007012 [Termitomyces sp. T159_Od127]|nr:hypothetical protein C0993_007012 [Termitomyces sp. T159_Od127]